MWAEARQHLEFVRRYFPEQRRWNYTLLFESKPLGTRVCSDAVRFGLRMFRQFDLQRLTLITNSLEATGNARERRGPRQALHGCGIRGWDALVL